MPAQFWRAPIGGPPVGAAGAAYNTSTALTDVSPTPNITISAGYLNYPGATLKLRAFGTFSNTATPTLLLGFYYGGVAGVAFGATTAITTVTGAANWPWRMEMDVIVRTDGSSGTVITSGTAHFPASVSAFNAANAMPATSLAVVTIDTTSAKAITVGAQWGTSSASNTLTCHGMTVESVA